MTTNGSQSENAQGLAALFASASLARLLGLFMLEPDQRFYQRELERLTGTTLRQLQRDLGRLEQSGLVVKSPSGNRTYYQAAASHPAFADLRRAFVKTVAFADVLCAAVATVAPQVAIAFVYGSFAAGDDTPDSDVDLLVIGDVSRRALARALAPASADLGREINPVIFTRDEFAQRRSARDHFVTAALAVPRIWIVGDEQSLSALA
jgi:predicted nucleotidyltransferase